MDSLKKEKGRIEQYDILRGIAISFMLMANSAASLYIGTPPLPMRLLGSFAAPSFMILAGIMLAIAKKPKLRKGFLLIATGCLIDIFVWQIVPFVTFDVLYTLGAAILITAYPARLFPIRVLWLLGVVFILVGQWLQGAFGYNPEILEIALPPQNPFPPIKSILSRILRQLFIDGWFPLPPWLGFVWLGAALQRSLQNTVLSHGNSFLMLCISIILFVVSSAYWSLNFVVPEPRVGYTELFYPPDVGFCFTSISAFCIALFLFQSIVRWQPALFILAPLKWMGQCSLWIYILHLVAIRSLLSLHFETPELNSFLFIVFMLWVFFAITARILSAYPFVSKRNHV
ncbi:heparan-alpha-glucosaminide N-acetyltransferase domain-containing protein [Crenothrix sp.]|uniref:heparan-alpha-glucosaminide N-acetyltransferase domain-containing protein n=1 Tax=Crenothrix sp. TaxID=3100433 RepID=UPI00374D3347